MSLRALCWSFLVFFFVVYVNAHDHHKPKPHDQHKPKPHDQQKPARPDGQQKPRPDDQQKPTFDDQQKPKLQSTEWKHAHATFYEGGSGTFGGACGYHDVVQEGYGLDTVALSNALFNKGEMCGACFEIKCEDSPQWCKPGQPSLIVTATNQCPPNYNQPSDNGGWCNEPREHFDIARPVFETIAAYKAGIVPVSYRRFCLRRPSLRIPCDHKTGGIKFTITGNPYFNEVLVWNVGGAGDVCNVKVKPEDQPNTWLPLQRMWGQRWIYNGKLCEQGALSFRVTSGDGRTVISENVLPKGWQFGQTYEGKNFAV
ncbi:putative expansin/Lol pI [Rosa chinensis]|uniref:Expansin n=1 Tax=Rosa chinensis TaxID=74649 RepID=A0A2P6RXA9_ROSCH|nr:putative expansin/Lol pI [Rosa chinensis]